MGRHLQNHERAPRRNALLAMGLTSLFGAFAALAEQPPASPSPTNWLKNGGFEEGEVAPAGWTKGPEVPGVEYLWTKAVAFEGRACVSLSKTEKRYFPIAEWYQDLPYPGAAALLHLKAMVKAQEVTKATLDVQYEGESGQRAHKWAAYIGAKNPGDPPVTHEWKEYAGDVEIPAGTKTIRVALQIYGPGIVALDAVSLAPAGAVAATGPSGGTPVASLPAPTPTASAPVPASTSAAKPEGATIPLVNPGFETGSQQPDGWQQGNPVPGVEYVWAREVAHSGTASLGLKKTVARYFPIAQWVQTVPRTGTAPRLRVAAWVKCDQVTKAILDVEFVRSNGQITHQWAAYIGAKDSTDPPVTHDWKQYSGAVPIPPDTTQLRIGLQMYGPGAVWFDDVEAQYGEWGSNAPGGVSEEDRRNRERALALLNQYLNDFRSGKSPLGFGTTIELGQIGDPIVIPTLIGIIDADNSYDTIYGAGYFGLGFMKMGGVTGVRYSPYHDGAWWRRWWEKNKSNFPEDVQEMPIPDLPKTENGKRHTPFPDDMDSLDGKLRWMRKKFDEGDMKTLADIAREIAEHGDPKAIPLLIGIIDADNSYDTIYGVGYYGLGYLELGEVTGVKYSESHDGAWWRQWWQDNKSRFPEDVQKIPIPDLPKTKAGRAHKPATVSARR